MRDTPTDMRIISVFNPPITGDETHDADGAYPPTGEIPPGRERMFVKTLADIHQAGMVRTVAGGVAISERYLTVDDHLGFSLNSVRLPAGAEADLWYKHHWEANLVLDGIVDVTDYATGAVHRLGPGGLYLVGPKDRHHVKVITDFHAISVFNPPLTGTEDHDADGSYPPTGPVLPGPTGSC
jgi:L-ectoine synthase